MPSESSRTKRGEKARQLTPNLCPGISAITAPVYRSIFEAARNSEGGATIVASVVDASDIRLIKAVFAGSDASRSGSVSLVFDRIAGTGKRDALATSLRTIRRLNPTRHDMIFLVDGDTRVPASLVAKSAPFFTDEKMGALTSDEVSDATGGRLFQDWFHLRFAQRQLMMSSMGLSEEQPDAEEALLRAQLTWRAGGRTPRYEMATDDPLPATRA